MLPIKQPLRAVEEESTSLTGWSINLDNTCGSGSFLVAAVLENRNFIGIEKNHEVHRFKNQEIDYIDVCEERIEEAYKSLDKEWIKKERDRY